jgi:predicted ATP-grasp superfamily ATP-dependent carboligase
VRDPGELYEMTGDVPELGRPVLIQALSGFVDAGGATRLAREHQLDTLDGHPVAAFDVDELLDYRSRRPTMIFVEDHWQSYQEPRIELHLRHDDAGTPFLLLTGPEPDLRWERFIAAVAGLVERLGVRLTVGLNAIPMAVPHTRPIGVTAHATRKELIAGHEPWLDRVQVPGSVGNLLEYRLGRRGHDAMGFAVHVPHYLSEATYPAAAEVLLASVSSATGLILPARKLHEAAEATRADIDRQIAETDDAAGVVQALEQQYDAYLRGRAGNLLAEDGAELPTADELGAQFEQFLAEHTEDQPPTP